MSTEKDKPLTKAALGRPFQLGTLYDCRTDAILLGLSLLDKQMPGKVVPKEYCSVHVITGEDIDSKTMHVDADIDIKLSLMNDMVKVEGSAHFLAEDINTDDHNRIVLHYTSTSRFEQLHMTQDMLGSIDKVGASMATHVVTGILYGADAFFEFDLARKETTTKLEAQGRLEAVFTGSGGIGFGGSIEGGLAKKDSITAEELSCTFHGDAILDPLPSNYKEAMESYRTLTPRIRGNGTREQDKSVPVKVWLVPLSALNVEGAGTVVKLDELKSISALRAQESFQNVIVAATTLLNSLNGSSPFLDYIQKEIKEFLMLVKRRKNSYTSEMKELLPLIRGGKKRERDLDQLVLDMTSSPYDLLGLLEWLDNKKNEAKTMKELLTFVEQKKKHIEFADRPGDFNKAILRSNRECKYLLVLFPSVPLPDLFLKRMKGTSQNFSTPWFMHSSKIVKLRNMFHSFAEFAVNNADRKEVKCVVAHYKEYHNDTDDKSTDDTSIACLKLYAPDENDDIPGEPIKTLSAKSFTLPSKLRKLRVSTDNDCVKLKWEMPSMGEENILNTIIKYHKTSEPAENAHLVAVLDKSTDSNSEYEITSELEKNVSYTFIVYAQCKIGDCEKSIVKYTVSQK